MVVTSINGVDLTTVPLHRQVKEKIEKGEKYFNLEYYPPRDEAGLKHILDSLDDIKAGGPLYIDVTWAAAQEPASDKPTSTMSVAKALLDRGIQVNMHLTSHQYDKEQTLQHLEKAKDLGVKNIFALRGLIPGAERSAYKHNALDLVKWIREKYQSYFTITVAGYATGHPHSKDYQEHLQYVKSKIDAGADQITTNNWYNVGEPFIQYVKDLRAIGITKPIIPGLMPVTSYENFNIQKNFSGIDPPKDLESKIEAAKEDPKAVEAIGIKHATDQIRKWLDAGATSVHIFTFGPENATKVILQNVGLWGK